MSTVWWILVVVLTELLLLVGAAAFFVRTIEKKNGKPIGDLWVDPAETAPGEGVYTIFNEDPKAFTDGQMILLRIQVRKDNKGHNGKSK